MKTKKIILRNECQLNRLYLYHFDDRECECTFFVLRGILRDLYSITNANVKLAQIPINFHGAHTIYAR